MRSKRSQTRKAMYNVVPLIQPSKQGTTMGTESVPVTAKGREQERKMLPEKGQYERFFFFLRNWLLCICQNPWNYRGEGNGSPPQYPYLGNLMDGSLADYSPWGHRVRHD